MTSTGQEMRIFFFGSNTEYEGLEIRVYLDVALRPRKTAMLVLNCTGAYGRNAVFRPSRLVGAMHEKLIPIFDF